MKQITVTIDEQGKATVDVVGFKGKQCDVAQAIESALGTTTKRTNKPEYTQQVTTTQKIGGRNG